MHGLDQCCVSAQFDRGGRSGVGDSDVHVLVEAEQQDVRSVSAGFVQGHLNGGVQVGGGVRLRPDSVQAAARR